MSFNLIRSVIVIIVSIALSACFYGETDWEVGYGWTSGWGNGPMYKINSEGRLELIKPYPNDENKLCTQKLDNKTLSKIRSKIDSIPSNIPKETEVKYLDNCADERENYIFITEGVSQLGFSYSQSNDCRRVEIPSWLISLNDELEKIKGTIEGCQIETTHNKVNPHGKI